jgi:hypothetical protein
LLTFGAGENFFWLKNVVIARALINTKKVYIGEFLKTRIQVQSKKPGSEQKSPDPTAIATLGLRMDKSSVLYCTVPDLLLISEVNIL